MSGITIGYVFVIVLKGSLPAPLVGEQGTLAAQLRVLFEAEVEVEVEVEVELGVEIEMGVEAEEMALLLEQGFAQPEAAMFAPAVALVL